MSREKENKNEKARDQKAAKIVWRGSQETPALIVVLSARVKRARYHRSPFACPTKGHNGLDFRTLIPIFFTVPLTTVLVCMANDHVNSRIVNPRILSTSIRFFLCRSKLWNEKIRNKCVGLFTTPAQVLANWQCKTTNQSSRLAMSTTDWQLSNYPIVYPILVIRLLILNIPIFFFFQSLSLVELFNN